MPELEDALELTAVEKTYGALRPLRIQRLTIQSGSLATLVGFDAPAAETFVNLITGAVLPEKGEVRSLGRVTSTISDGEAWLAFVGQFGFVTDRAALLDGLTVAQNLALPFDLEIDPIPASVVARVLSLGDELGVEPSNHDVPIGHASPMLRAKVRLGRALALDPRVVVLEHPTATLAPTEISDYAALVRSVWNRREITVLVLTADERFGKAIGVRTLYWKPATGELKEKKSWF
jgi:ABC-type transporter Mla maintaining outer membrane lipid asymmetry ATPase subunit MlaF